MPTRLNGAVHRRILLERVMSSDLVVIARILAQYLPQMVLAVDTMWSRHSRRMDPHQSFGKTVLS